MSEREKVPPSMTAEEFEERRAAQEEAEEQAAKERREANEKESARRAWVAEGGDEAGFEREWPELRSEMLRARTAERHEQQRRASDRYYENSF